MRDTKFYILIFLVTFTGMNACQSSADSSLTGDLINQEPVIPDPTKTPEAQALLAGSREVNRVRLIVGSVAITDQDVLKMKKSLRKTRRGKRNLEKLAVDQLIERAIVGMEAEKQSIIVSDLRLQNEVKRRMQMSGVSDENKFRKSIERETGASFDHFLSEMRYQITQQHLARIVLSVPQATDREIEKFYRKNRRKIGVEVRYREMIFQGRGKTESEISRIAHQVQRQVRSQPASFANVARSHPQNAAASRVYGGLKNFREISEISLHNKILAGVLFNTGAGSVSPVFRDSRGRYMVIKVERKRPIPIDKVRDLIQRRLYFDRQGKVFEEWIEKRRREVAIVVLKK